MNLRFFKIRTASGWKQTVNLDAVKDPIDSYFSVSRWIDSKHIGKKYTKSGKLQSSIFLGSSMVIDIDAKHFPNQTLDEAYAQMLKIDHYLYILGLTNNKYVFTGGGFHIWVTEWEEKFIKKNIASAKQRYRYYEYKRKKFIRLLKKQNFIFDYSISLDNHRVVRLPGTYHRNGAFVKIADKPELCFPHEACERATAMKTVL